MAAAARRARLEESWAWIESELDDYDAEPPADSPYHAGSMSLEPLYDAVDSIVGKNPTLLLRRPALTQMVTGLVEKVGDNPSEATILSACSQMEESLVQHNRIGFLGEATPQRRSFQSNDKSQRQQQLARPGTPNGPFRSSGFDERRTPDLASQPVSAHAIHHDLLSRDSSDRVRAPPVRG